MAKITPNKPVLIILYGYPGSGKSFFATQFCKEFFAAHLYGDKIRHELFENPKRNKRENEVINNIMEYMAEEFMKAGVSVVYDSDTFKRAQRLDLRNLAIKHGARSVLVWLQVDKESAFLRIARRDRRKVDDKFAGQYDRSTFDDLIKEMQSPSGEDYVVISGKHTYNAQKSAVLKKLFDNGIIDSSSATTSVVKPELVNLVPPVRARRIDTTRRDIVIK